MSSAQENKKYWLWFKSKQGRVSPFETGLNNVLVNLENQLLIHCSLCHLEIENDPLPSIVTPKTLYYFLNVEKREKVILRFRAK